MTILDTVERSLANFRPKSHRQFVAFNIARRFDDLYHLAKYLNICEGHPKKVLLEAARLAERHAAGDAETPRDRFFALLEVWGRKEAA
jgi:hypothetical protein